MIKFEVVEAYKDKNINLPKRGTKYSAGYDIEAAEDIVVSSIFKIMNENTNVQTVIDIDTNRRHKELIFNNIPTTVKNIEEAKEIVKKYQLRTMVPTGIKVKMENNMFLELHPRSSTGSNCLLQLPNQTAIIDADYYNNPTNEGHLTVPLINLSPVDIMIKKGDKIAQGIFQRYEITDDDNATGLRSGGFGSTDDDTVLESAT